LLLEVSHETLSGPPVLLHNQGSAGTE